MRENGQLPEERAAAVKRGQVTTWENTQCRFFVNLLHVGARLLPVPVEAGGALFAPLGRTGSTLCRKRSCGLSSTGLLRLRLPPLAHACASDGRASRKGVGWWPASLDRKHSGACVTTQEPQRLQGNQDNSFCSGTLTQGKGSLAAPPPAGLPALLACSGEGQGSGAAG